MSSTKIGLLLITTGILMAAFTGNILGFSKREQEREKSMREKLSQTNGEDKEAKSYLFYFNMNEKIRKASWILILLGLAILMTDKL